MEKENKSFTKSLVKSFGFAIDGFYFLLAERNFKIHLIVAIIVVLCGFYFEISLVEWGLIAITIGLVLTGEAFNTAIEQLCNRITSEHDLLIGRIKDISAAAVLILAISAVIVGLVIFVPKIL